MSFKKQVQEKIDAIGQNEMLKSSAHAFMQASVDSKYSYNFSWLGRPIIQYPQDMVAMQELLTVRLPSSPRPPLAYSVVAYLPGDDR